MAPNSTPPRLVNSQLVSLPPVGILNLLCLICIVFVDNAHLIIFTWNLRNINVSYYYELLFAYVTYFPNLNISKTNADILQMVNGVFNLLWTSM